MPRTIVLHLNWFGEKATLKLPFAERVKTQSVTLGANEIMQVCQSLANGGIGVTPKDTYTFTCQGDTPEPVPFPVPLYISPGCIVFVQVVEEN